MTNPQISINRAKRNEIEAVENGDKDKELYWEEIIADMQMELKAEKEMD